LILQIDTGETGSPAYDIITENYKGTIFPDSSVTYRFTVPYSVPWNINYYPRIYAYLGCDSALVNATTAIAECVDMNDLYMVNIDQPSTGIDTGLNTLPVTATLYNRSDIAGFSNVRITVSVRNSQGTQTETFSETIATITPLSTVSHTFAQLYTVPNDTLYYLTVYTDSYDNYRINDTITIERRTNKGDDILSIVSIDNPATGKDKIEREIYVTASLYNHSNFESFAGVNISVLVTNSQGVQTETFTEQTNAIGTLATISHIFSQSYTVPNDSIYYLTVYTDSYDNYSRNDTMTIKRYTETVGIHSIDGTNVFALGQNVPNPANENTLINYSVPEAGEVFFHVHSISGQLLYSKTIEAPRGTQSIELNTAMLSAGVYFYSMEYKGERIVKRMSVR
jgi:hypothetical protein